MEIPTRTPTSCALTKEASASKEVKSLYANEKGWLSVIPEEYSKITLEECKELPAKLLTFGEEWAKGQPLKSLYLYGTYGSGKTTFAFAIIRKHLQLLNGRWYFWPNYLTGRQLDTALLKASKHDDGDEWELEKHSESDLLFIDDIDKVTGTERFKVQLFEIINRRLIGNKPTIITSNCQPMDLGSLLDGAVVSRMGDIRKWQMVNFPSKDLRCLQTLNFN